MRTIARLAFAALPLFANISPAQNLDKNFLRTAQHETLFQFWSVLGGETISQEWSGLLEVIVSGFGVNVPASGFLEDAFYPIVPSNIEHKPKAGG